MTTSEKASRKPAWQHRFTLFGHTGPSFGVFSKLSRLVKKRRARSKRLSSSTSSTSLFACCCTLFGTTTRRSKPERTTTHRSSSQHGTPSQTITYSSTSVLSKEESQPADDLHPAVAPAKVELDTASHASKHSSKISTPSVALPQRSSSPSLVKAPSVSTGSFDSQAQWLLPPACGEFKHRKCLVLDLDETLVHSSFKMTHHADYVLPIEIEGRPHNVFVLKRPGVDTFMKRMGELYEIVVFTASMPMYADAVLDKVDIHQVVRHRLYRDSCFHYKGTYVKDLSQLGRNLTQVIILDNSPLSYIFHTANAIPITTWFQDPHDSELIDLIPFLEDLAPRDIDVTEILDNTIPGPFSHL